MMPLLTSTKPSAKRLCVTNCQDCATALGPDDVACVCDSASFGDPGSYCDEWPDEGTGAETLHCGRAGCMRDDHRG